MTYEQAAPCRNQGAPPARLVEQVSNLLLSVISEDEDYLVKNGLSRTEFKHALPAAIEQIRGSWAANNSSSRAFVNQVMQTLTLRNVIARYDPPKYGHDTVYRVYLHDGKQIGLIQKGCPDGAHSSSNWARPAWADELYLWWLCDSLKYNPGEHIWKGVARVARKVRSEPENQLDGIIFFNSKCGTVDRPCPKATRATLANGDLFPPPCIYVFPHMDSQEPDLNWHGSITRRFPKVLLSAFDVDEGLLQSLIGYVGFRASGNSTLTEITSRFGRAKATSFRG